MCGGGDMKLSEGDGNASAQMLAAAGQHGGSGRGGGGVVKVSSSSSCDCCCCCWLHRGDTPCSSVAGSRAHRGVGCSAEVDKHALPACI
jgi:hypothetical protein